jgi:hypothetical protein
MTTFLEEVVGESTWMFPFELGCTNDGSKTGEIKAQGGPIGSSEIGKNKGEITSIAIGKGDATFDSVGNHSPPRLECENFGEPPPSKGKGIEK